MNHPEKVTVAGSGTKNRYKTIIPSTCKVITQRLCLVGLLHHNFFFNLILGPER